MLRKTFVLPSVTLLLALASCATPTPTQPAVPTEAPPAQAQAPTVAPTEPVAAPTEVPAPTTPALAGVQPPCTPENATDPYPSGKIRLVIGTGGTGGVFYPYGGGIARILSEKMPNTEATAEVTGGSVDNNKLLAKGEIDIGLSTLDSAFWKLRGSIQTPTSIAITSVSQRASTRSKIARLTPSSGLVVCRPQP